MARQVLQRIFQPEGARAEFDAICSTISLESHAVSRFSDVFQPRYRKLLAIAMLLAAFAQFSGINVVSITAPRCWRSPVFNPVAPSVS